ncbi:hypothetical protein HpBT030_12090 [Helicobacter pylori]
MAVRFGVIFITDNYTIDRRVDRVNGRTSEITAFMVFTNESEFKKLLASVSQLR